MKSSGYLQVSGEGAKERDTFTCGHCNCIVIIEPNQLTFKEFCTGCMKPICDECGRIIGCLPFEKKIERLEQRSYQWQQVTKLIGTR